MFRSGGRSECARLSNPTYIGYNVGGGREGKCEKHIGTNYPPPLLSLPTAGMKCLLLDKDTKALVSMVYSMNEILSKEVYLVESLEANHDSLGHMKAIVIARPTNDSIKLIAAQLKNPKFQEYHIFFTNIVPQVRNGRRRLAAPHSAIARLTPPPPQELLRKLADADHLCLVRHVQELYADFHAINVDLFSLSLNGSLTLSRPKVTWAAPEEIALRRCTSGLLALLLSLKLKPTVRYASSSEAAASIAREVVGAIGGERELFTFNRTSGSPLLLIIDRKEDPITPLLMQWTYQAMVHELLPGGILNNRVNLRSAKGVSKDLEEVVLSPSDDVFFRENMYNNYGDVAANIQSMLDEYTKEHKKTSESLSSIEDMQRFVDRYPELKSKGLAVGKHVALMSEMGNSVDARRAMELSEIEQNISCSENAADHLEEVQNFLMGGSGGGGGGERGPADPFDALRLTMLYALRYERAAPRKVADLRRFVAERLDMQDSLSLIDALLKLAGAGMRAAGLFETPAGTAAGMLHRLASTVKRSVAGVQNVYTQHQPLMTTLLDQLARGKLSRSAFPFVGSEAPPGKISTVVVFFVGGTTYEEAAKVADINAGRLILGGPTGGPALASPLLPGAPLIQPPFRVILGGTTVHSAKSFLAELQRSASGGGSHVALNMGEDVM